MLLFQIVFNKQSPNYLSLESSSQARGCSREEVDCRCEMRKRRREDEGLESCEWFRVPEVLEEELTEFSSSVLCCCCCCCCSLVVGLGEDVWLWSKFVLFLVNVGNTVVWEWA